MESLYLSFLQILSERNARYLVAGGIAVNLYGCERVTRDLDLIIDLDDPKSMEALFSACKSFDLIPLVPVKLEDFGIVEIREKWIKEKNMIVFGLTLPDNPFYRIDIFVEKPENFEEIFCKKKIVEVENEGKKFNLHLISKNDLIEMKRNAGRDKDLLDVNNLTKITDYE